MMTRHEQALQILRKGTVIPANPLVLDENRRFDEEGQRLLTKYYLYSGSGGIAAAGHTTQFEIRLPQFNLYEKVLEVVSDEISAYEAKNNKVIVKVAGVCGDTKQAVAEAIKCRDYGFDAVLLSPGGLDALSEAELLNRTRAVADILPVIGFYLQSAVGGRVFSYHYWQNTADIENVVAIKCASFNRYTTLDVVRAVASSSRCEDIALYTGNDDNIVMDLLTEYSFSINGKTIKKSFDGGLLGHWSVWTKNAVALFDEIQKCRGDKLNPELLTLAAQITDANAVLFDVANNFKGCIAGLHEVLHRQGLMRGIWCLNPSETLSAGQADEIDRIYKMYPHLNDDAFIAANIKSWANHTD